MSANSQQTADLTIEPAQPRGLRIHPTVKRCAKDRTIQICAGLLLALFFVSFVVPLTGLFPNGQSQDSFNIRAEPSGDHWLGTDQLGRDVLARVIEGGQISLTVGFIAVAIAMTVGIPIGLLSGGAGGMLDAVIMRTVDVVMAIPTILLALAIIAALGPGITNAMIAIGFVFVPTFARLVRGEALTARSQDYVLAARSIGANPLRIIVIHVFPATWPSLIVQISVSVAFAMLVEAGLSFLGLGAQPPTPSWGAMLQQGYPFARTDPGMVLGPGFAIFAAVLAFNVMGDALRDVLDPRLRNRDASPQQ